MDYFAHMMFTYAMRFCIILRRFMLFLYDLYILQGESKKNYIWSLARKMTYFIFPKTFLRFRVRVSEKRLNTFSVKHPFGQVY